MERYKNRYRINSSRAPWWDYRSAGAYFVTICTHQKALVFGNISKQNMELSALGIIADICWFEIKNHHKHIQLDAFIVMPNHVHGIIILSTPNTETCPPVETRHALSLPPAPHPPPFPFPTNAFKIRAKAVFPRSSVVINRP
ncbi:MAG: transposase [Deinococcales bacterium]